MRNGKRCFLSRWAILIAWVGFSLCSFDGCGPTGSNSSLAPSSVPNLVATNPSPSNLAPNPSPSCIILGQQSTAPTCSSVVSTVATTSVASTVTTTSSTVATTSSASCSPALPASVTANGASYTVSAQITGYGWPDNSPPGAQISSPILHQTAGGDGSYCNPITFATETANNTKFPPGTMIYVPPVHRYFIREDTCAGCSGIWFDLWVGGDGSNNSGVLACEGTITSQGVTVTVNPPSTEQVIASPGAVFNNGTCDP
jgi:hypothetical protein